MGSSRRADIVRDKLAQGGKGLSFAAACQLVRSVVITALPAKASDRDRAEWTSVVDAVIALAASCQSLSELETKITEQSAALRKAPENAVVLSTIHSAKGLEWEAVSLIGMEQGVLPHTNNDDLEEERRVAYVGITRAKRLLGLTYSAARFGQKPVPSQFLRELRGEKDQCIWTTARADGSDERLPLLSDRERQQLKDGPPPKRAAKRATKSPRRPANDQTRLAKEAKNKAEGRPARHGVAWSPEEDERLRELFIKGAAIAAMVKAHQRKRGAIRSRLLKLGLIEDDAS
jgi:DNA helicase-2/ATP-dependent DNA helicase PcrA